MYTYLAFILDRGVALDAGNILPANGAKFPEFQAAPKFGCFYSFHFKILCIV